MKRLYFINGRYLGQSPIPAHLSWKTNLFWYCDTCGEVYARLPVEDRPNGPGSWSGMTGVCGKCEARPMLSHRLPGSIWDTVFSGLHKDFPEEVLRYELLLELDNFEKELQDVI